MLVRLPYCLYHGFLIVTECVTLSLFIFLKLSTVVTLAIFAQILSRYQTHTHMAPAVVALTSMCRKPSPIVPWHLHSRVYEIGTPSQTESKLLIQGEGRQRPGCPGFIRRTRVPKSFMVTERWGLPHLRLFINYTKAKNACSTGMVIVQQNRRVVHAKDRHILERNRISKNRPNITISE